jgi:hypothetical protein
VTAVASNENGSAMQQWLWQVQDVPLVAFVPPSDTVTATVSRNWTFVNVTVSAAAAISSCWLEWGGANESMTLVGSGGQVSCHRNKTANNGAYSYRVYANNSQNTFNISELRSVIISAQAADTTPPAITPTVAAEVVNGTDASIVAAAADSSGVAGIWAVIRRPDGSGATINLTNASAALFAVTMTGDYNVTIYASDAAGNVGSASVSFASVICITGNTRRCGNILSDAGACEFGTETCTNNAWGPCAGVVGPAAESCNGLDDNCDGQTDEGSDCCTTGQSRQCGTAIGACEFGTSTCVNSVWSACQGGIDPLPNEVCNDGLDNNCNGQVDENCDAIGLACANKIQDGNEEGVDCGGSCPTACAGPIPLVGFFLIMGGVAVLVVIIVLVSHYKSRGKELTWEELKKKWTSAGKI